MRRFEPKEEVGWKGFREFVANDDEAPVGRAERYEVEDPICGVADSDNEENGDEREVFCGAGGVEEDV